jgi:hypothetical protein
MGNLVGSNEEEVQSFVRWGVFERHVYKLLSRFQREVGP